MSEPPRRIAVLAGATTGVLAAVAGVLVAEMLGFGFLFAAVPILIVTLVGLWLGSLAAIAAYAAATGALLATVLLTPAPTGSSTQLIADSVRIASFVLGTPLVILLVRRAETARRLVVRARDASVQAEQQAVTAGDELEVARVELSAALAAAERERARLEEVAESIPEPLIVYDAELRGTYANRAAFRLFGRSFVERQLDEWGRSTEPRDDRGAPLRREEWPQVEAQHGPIRRRLIVRLPMSGRDLMIDVEGTPIAGGGCVLLLRDIGKEEDERRRLSRFASFVAHELRNPLAVAKARIELANRAAVSPKAEAHGARALESVDAAIRILERLELFSRAELGRIEAQREPFRLADAVAAATERLRVQGTERQLIVDVEDGLTALGDRQLSEGAITNLLTNAERYSRPGTAISLRGARAGRDVELQVADGGPGIADEVAGRLFRERVEGGGGLGLGIGLYLVGSTMDAQGGSVELSQRRPHSIFTLRWPAA